MRHPWRFPLGVRVVDRPEEGPAELRAIDHGGLTFGTNEPYEPGDTVEISMNLRQPEVIVKGEVLWCKASSANNAHKFVVLTRFFDEDTYARVRLREEICHIERYRQCQCERGRDLSTHEAATEWISQHAHLFPK
jgi:Tfp pilus assembly protein PilZ